MYKIIFTGYLLVQNFTFTIAQCPSNAFCHDYQGTPSLLVIFTSPLPNNFTVTIDYEGVIYEDVVPYLTIGSQAYYVVPFCTQNETGNAFFDIQFTLSDGTICPVIESPPTIEAVCPEQISCSPATDPGNPSWNCPENTNIIQVLTDPNAVNPNMNGVQFYFEDNPLLNGIYSPCGLFGSTYGYDIDCTQSPTTLVFSQGNEDEKVCTYDEDGILCPSCDPYFGPPCEDYFTACSQGLIDFAVNELGGQIECQQWKGTCDLDNTIWRLGKVAIGTDSFHPNFQLTVKGGIMTEHFRLCNEENPIYWCDYVFEKGYDLWPLGKVASYIKEKGHLHKTKSEKEVKAAGGFELTEVTLDHQEKIEEIFLHLIDLDNQLSTMENLLKNND